MTKWLAILMACLALALVAVGCGDDDEDEGGGGAATTEQPAGGGGKAEKKKTQPAAETVDVTMKDIAFNPNSVQVAPGTTVKWTNDDSVGHDVTKTSGPGPDFSSGSPGGLNEGDIYEQTFRKAGTIKYECTVHPGMTGEIIVKK